MLLSVAAVSSSNHTPTPTLERIFLQVIPYVPRGKAPQELQLTTNDTMVAIGDSITVEGSYLDYVEQVLAANYPKLNKFKIVNAGKGGHRAEHLIARFASDVIACHPSLVMINVGINDVAFRLEEPHQLEVFKAYRENVDKMVEMAQSAGIRVILLAPTIIQEDPNAPGNLRLPLYAHAMRVIADSKQCQFVDLHAMFLSALRHRSPQSQGRWLTLDGIHMRPLGSALMALGVLRALGVPDAKIAATAIDVSQSW